MNFELVDLRDFNLPLFDEAASNAWVPSKSPEAVAWQKKIGGFDGYIFITAEYNHSMTGSLKDTKVVPVRLAFDGVAPSVAIVS